MKLQRFKVSRKFAKPVERIINALENDDMDLYDIMGVSNRNADTGVLKKQYRNVALLVHPGKRLNFKAFHYIYIYMCMHAVNFYIVIVF